MKWGVVLTIVVLFLILLVVRVLRLYFIRQATFHIRHMQTEADAMRIAMALKTLPGPIQVHVDLVEHVATVRYRADRTCIDQLLTAIHTAGY